ncbi:hypothetical protein [Scytonema sp. HK-05]|nr:hypothetical protein [Scytonema sp. HK-05]
MTEEDAVQGDAVTRKAERIPEGVRALRCAQSPTVRLYAIATNKSRN